jgi:hypothetical protein
VPLAVSFLANLRLAFLNHQPAVVDKRLIKQLQESAPLSLADLDAAAFLSLQDLRGPKYATALEQFMAETMEADDEDAEIYQPIQNSGVQHRHAPSVNQEAEYARTSAYGRHSHDLFASMNVRPSAIDPFGSNHVTRLTRPTEYPDQRNRPSSQLSNLVYLPEGSSYRSSGANTKLVELNKTYQTYINYLQQQSLAKQQQAESTAVEEGTEEQESAYEPECLVSLTPAAFYGRLLSLELSTFACRGKPDALLAKIVALQAFARGLLVRRRLQLKLVFDKAATFLQAYFRGHRVRARVAAALRQLHKSVLEEEKRMALDDAAQSGKNVVKEEVKVISPIEEKLMALEEENKKMREKLDQQNELMLSFLASQNISQLNVSNRLLSDLKNDISSLKESSKKGKIPEKKKKVEKKPKDVVKSSKKGSPSQQSPTKEHPKILQESLIAEKSEQLTEIDFRQEENIENLEQEIVLSSNSKDHKEITDVIKEDPEEHLIEETSFKELDAQDNSHSEDDKKSKNQDKINIDEDSSDKREDNAQVEVKEGENELVELEDEPIEKENEEIRTINEKNHDEEASKDESSSHNGEEEESIEEKDSEGEEELSENEEESPENSQDSEKDDSEINSSKESKSKSSINNKKGSKNQEFHINFPLNLEECIVNEEYVPPEDEFTAHMIDENSIVNKSGLLPELSTDRIQINSLSKGGSKQNSAKNLHSNTKNLPLTGRYSAQNSKSASSRSQNRNLPQNYNTSLNKSGSSGRIGVSYQGGLDNSIKKERPASTYASIPKSQSGIRGSATSKSSSSGVTTVDKNKKISSSLATKPPIPGVFGQVKVGTSPSKTGIASTKNSVTQKPIPSPLTKPTSSSTGGTQSLRSKIGSMTKTASSGLFGKR